MNAEKYNELKSYIMGFVFSVILTSIPFYAVYTKAFSPATLYIVIAIAAVTQIAVQFRFFLHINFSKQKREDLHLILFTVLLLIIMVGGTLWIMTDLSSRMH
ncbi:cytochrome o ubiquinol oxidase subunit IV [Alteromonas pelagimontana]|uniref:Cytochrome bo(3) ubiquinol oxidase subunit 4 n=1 Tax=Alteromonas pelagimontana TaxID=1858656 RepID=A0A6M4MIC7_9ALTE|nr:cytochrome o ubiquinol oxidase subunit IV [Alteromonas pelagimontana]QJR82360.1 cytochrome o ubiquinol oxidase subunit IV [Alteromonas pelagimontana]